MTLVLGVEIVGEAIFKYRSTFLNNILLINYKLKYTVAGMGMNSNSIRVYTH